MNDSAPTQRLDHLLFEYLERVEGGEPAPRVLAELSEAHPMDAGALKRSVSLLRDVRLHPGPAGDLEPIPTPGTPAARPRRAPLRWLRWLMRTTGRH